jgi:hypothetical protein
MPTTEEATQAALDEIEHSLSRIDTATTATITELRKQTGVLERIANALETLAKKSR